MISSEMSQMTRKSAKTLFVSIWVLLFLLAAGVAGWQWWRAEGIEQTIEFQEARVRILERENARLAEALQVLQAERREQNDATWRDEITKRVEQLRELEFLHAVAYRTLSKEELPALIESKIAEQYSDDEIVRLSRMYAGIGLLPEGFDLKQAYIELFAEQVAAFYDQHADALYLFEETPLDHATNRMILAHELVHALQDQHFQLELLPLQLKENDDRALAASALVEGDATLAMMLFLVEDTEPGRMVSALVSGIFSQNMTALTSSPPFLRESLLFPYTKGHEFVSAIHARAGMQGVNAAFKRLPNSSRQILHPNEYLEEEHLFSPAEVEWAEPLSTNAEVLGVNVLGEFGLRILLGQWLEPAHAESAAKGWAGDGYRVSAMPDGSLAVEFESWWDSPKETVEAADALAEAWAERHAIQGNWNKARDLWQSDDDAGRHVQISVSGNVVRLFDLPSQRAGGER